MEGGRPPARVSATAGMQTAAALASSFPLASRSINKRRTDHVLAPAPVPGLWTVLPARIHSSFAVLGLKPIGCRKSLGITEQLTCNLEFPVARAAEKKCVVCRPLPAIVVICFCLKISQPCSRKHNISRPRLLRIKFVNNMKEKKKKEFFDVAIGLPSSASTSVGWI